ncbi:hypothetical protein F5Y03DRAFT_347158 [Xylaria venustula]|nr:hypothetical protein F5Y03DRAFT_347158 [Xylaria venustula]
MALDCIAPELLLSILTSLDSPQDLYSLVRASPASWRVFLTWRKTILSLVIWNAFPDTIHHALAILHIPKAPLGAEHPDIEDLKAFLDQYFQSDPWEFPTDLSSIISLTRWTVRISRFIDGYFDFAMRTLAMVHDHDGSWPLSRTERARLQRAFLRFGIYCQVCPTFNDHPYRSFLPSNLQFTYFLGKLEPWEVEEITCVYEYFTTTIEQYIIEMEGRFIRAVLTNPHLRAPPNHNLQDDQVENREKSGINRAGNMQDFSALELTDLELFSTDSKDRLRDYARYMASLGLETLKDLLSSDTDRRWDIIRHESPLWREFLPAALEHAPKILSETIIPGGDFTDSSSVPSRGWFEFKGVSYDLYLDIHVSGPIQRLVRICGYVFWGSKRVLRPSVYEAFKTARSMREGIAARFYSSTRGKSAEKKLKGFQLPESEMLKIMDEFGTKLSAETD